MQSTPSAHSTHSDDNTLLWTAVFLMGITFGNLAYHLQTGTTPSAASAMPLWLSLPLSIFVGLTALRVHGPVRAAVVLFALSLMVGALAPTIGFRGWAGWTTQQTLVFASSILVIVGLRHSTRVRRVTIAAVLLLVIAASHGTRRYAYDIWLRANKQHSVMTP